MIPTMPFSATLIIQTIKENLETHNLLSEEEEDNLLSEVNNLKKNWTENLIEDLCRQKCFSTSWNSVL